MATNNQNIGTKLIKKNHRSIYVTLRFHHIIKIKYKKIIFKNFIIMYFEYEHRIYFVEGIFFIFYIDTPDAKWLLYGYMQEVKLSNLCYILSKRYI